LGRIATFNCCSSWSHMISFVLLLLSDISSLAHQLHIVLSPVALLAVSQDSLTLWFILLLVSGFSSVVHISHMCLSCSIAEMALTTLFAVSPCKRFVDIVKYPYTHKWSEKCWHSG
jgi:hypothetical protein